MQTPARIILEAVARRFSVLKNFLKLTGKHQCPSLFLNKVTGLKTATSLKTKRWYKFWEPLFYRTPAVAESAF